MPIIKLPDGNNIDFPKYLEEQYKKKPDFIQFQFISPQIIYGLRHYDYPFKGISHQWIICNFDIDICQVRFDGTDIFGTFAFIFAISSLTFINYSMSNNLINRQILFQSNHNHHSFAYLLSYLSKTQHILSRNNKYTKRGFILLKPRNCILNIIRKIINKKQSLIKKSKYYNRCKSLQQTKYVLMWGFVNRVQDYDTQNTDLDHVFEEMINQI